MGAPEVGLPLILPNGKGPARQLLAHVHPGNESRDLHLADELPLLRTVFPKAQFPEAFNPTFAPRRECTAKGKHAAALMVLVVMHTCTASSHGRWWQCVMLDATTALP